MHVCTNCNYSSGSNEYLCPNCGTKLKYFENEEQYEQFKASLEPPRPNMTGKKVPGMIMGILGFAQAIFCAIYSLLLSMYSRETAIAFIVIYVTISMALSIVGRVLCRQCVKSGDNGAVKTTAGLALAGIIITAFVFTITIISFT